MIQEYLSGSVNLDELFENLVEFSQELNEEEQRYIREELGSDEELAVFDLLTKPDMDLNQKQIKQVKAVARKLLKTQFSHQKLYPRPATHLGPTQPAPVVL